jgi:hypothetical protein
MRDPGDRRDPDAHGRAIGKIIERQMTLRALKEKAEKRIAAAIAAALADATSALKDVGDPQAVAEKMIAEVLEGARSRIVSGMNEREREAREARRGR